MEQRWKVWTLVGYVCWVIATYVLFSGGDEIWVPVLVFAGLGAHAVSRIGGWWYG